MEFQPEVKKDFARGPNGEMVPANTYSNGRYSVTIQLDGAIRVKRGDWLSKYSAALHNDYTKIHEFGRMDGNGKLRPIQDVNVINAGEIVYHTPTYYRTHEQRMDDVQITGVALSDEEKKQLIVDTLEGEFHLQGETLHILEEASHYVHFADGTVQITEIAGLIVEGTALATAATIFGIVAGFLTSIGSLIAAINANDSDRKIAGMQAIWYTLTAWAFGDPVPPPYPRVLRSRVLNFKAGGTYGLSRVEPAWRQSAEAMVRKLEADVVKKRIRKDSYQLYWQSIGEHDRRKLARLIAEPLAKRLERRELDSFNGLDPGKYPNNIPD